MRARLAQEPEIACNAAFHGYPRGVRAVGIHLNPEMGRDEPPGRSAVAEITSQGALLGVQMCRTDEEICAAVGESPALLVVDAPIAIPDGPGGRRDVEQVLAWLDIPAFPVTRARMEKVHGGARGPALAAALSAHTTVEGIPDQVLRQLLWEREHPIGSAALGLADYRAQWLGVRAPAFRPRGGRARHDGLAPARDVLADAVDLAAWPAPGRTGDLAALDEAAAIDAAACAITAYRCLHGTADSWARIGTANGGRVLIPACPDLIERAVVNIARLADEGSIAMPLEVAGGAVGPAHSW